MYSGAGLFLMGLALAVLFGQEPILAIIFPGFGLAFTASTFAYLVGLHCQMCSGNLGPLVMNRGWLSIDPRVCFCPYCGARMDDDLPTEPPSVLRHDAEQGAAADRGNGS